MYSIHKNSYILFVNYDASLRCDGICLFELIV